MPYYQRKILSTPFCFRAMLLGKTTGLLQLYFQPFLQGYPAFNDFAAIYNASTTLSMLAGGDIAPLFEGDLNATIRNFMMNLPKYLNAIAMITKEFSNASFMDESQRQEVMVITGTNFVSLFLWETSCY